MRTYSSLTVAICRLVRILRLSCVDNPSYQRLSASYFQQPGGPNPDPALPAENGVLTLGYGSGGTVPYTFYLRPDQTKDIGFLKLYLSNQPIDLSYIPQMSPFSADRDIKPDNEDTSQVWDTITITLVQHRPEALSEPEIPNAVSMEDVTETSN